MRFASRGAAYWDGATALRLEFPTLATSQNSASAWPRNEVTAAASSASVSLGFPTISASAVLGEQPISRFGG